MLYVGAKVVEKLSQRILVVCWVLSFPLYTELFGCRKLFWFHCPMVRCRSRSLGNLVAAKPCVVGFKKPLRHSLVRLFAGDESIMFPDVKSKAHLPIGQNRIPKNHIDVASGNMFEFEKALKPNFFLPTEFRPKYFMRKMSPTKIEIGNVKQYLDTILKWKEHVEDTEFHHKLTMWATFSKCQMTKNYVPI